MTVECMWRVIAVLAQPRAIARMTAMYVVMSSPSPPWLAGMAPARKPSRQRSRQLSIGLAAAVSYSAARGAMRSRVNRSARSTIARWISFIARLLAPQGAPDPARQEQDERHEDD